MSACENLSIDTPRNRVKESKRNSETNSGDSDSSVAELNQINEELRA